MTTSKPSGVSATRSHQREFERAAQKLAVYYVFGILAILLFSSLAVYNIFSEPTPTTATTTPPICLADTCRRADVDHHSDLDNLLAFREHIESVLAVVDLAVLILAGIFAYFFARKTLRPIEILYRDQERFMADVAHELRTPLAVLHSGAEVLLRKERQPSEYMSYLTELQDETDRMTRIVNDLLFLLKFKQQAVQQKNVFDLAALAREQVHQFTDYAATHDVSITVNAPVPVTFYGVSDNIVRLLQNLLKNAIDYNRPGGSVTVNIAAVGPAAQLQVADTGIGITIDDQQHIFDRFYKSDRSRTQQGDSGTGLGLAIVKEIIEAHNGQITLASIEGEGTTITIDLPIEHTGS